MTAILRPPAADLVVQSELTAEATARSNADTALADSVTAEATARAAAVAAEQSAREAGDTANATAIADEATTRGLADADLDTRVDATETHLTRTDNPHTTTKAQVGLANADNTSDMDKPVSTAQGAALALRGALAGDNDWTAVNNFDANVRFKRNPIVDLTHPDFGAEGNDSDDDLAANNAALENGLAFAAGFGATCFMPEGVFRFNTPITALRDSGGIKLVGGHVPDNSTTQSGARLIYRGAVGPAFDLRGSHGLIFENLDVRYDNPAFLLSETRVNGTQAWPAASLTVLDTTGFPSSGLLWTRLGYVAYTGLTPSTFTGCTGGSSGTLLADEVILDGDAFLFRSGRYDQGLGRDSAHFSFEHCTIGGLSTAADDGGCLLLDRAIFADIHADHFYYGRRAVVGGAGTNILTVDKRTLFQFFSKHPVYAPSGGQSWTVRTAGFEGMSTGFVGAVELEGTMWAFSFRNNWLGDNAVGRTGHWLKADHASSVILGLEVDSNMFNTPGDVASNRQLRFNRVEGGRISCNEFGGVNPYIEFLSAAPKSSGIVIEGNNVGIGTLVVDLTKLTGSHIVGNDGYRTHQGATSSIPSGSTNVTINHGLAVTPAVRDFLITPTTNPTNDPGHIWVSNVTSTQFRVNCRNDPGASGFSFQWKVDAGMVI